MMMFLGKDLDIVFKALAAGGTSVQVRKQTITPISIDGKASSFEVKQNDLPIACDICSTTITTSKNQNVRERLLRMHMSAHQIAQEKGLWKGLPIPSDACMYCCKSAESSGCEVTIEDNRVVPKCKTYHVPTFEKRFLGTTLVYLSSNQPVQCPRCDKWVTSYNLLAHALTHGVTRDDMER